MAKTKEKTVDFSERMESVQRQFKNLDTKDPSVWPVLPKVILCIFIAGAVAAVSWFAFLQEYETQLDEERNKELGIDTAIWRNMQDSRVRGNPNGLYPKAKPSHWKREGKEFKWSEGIDGELPGEPIQCRCFAQSVIKY